MRADRSAAVALVTAFLTVPPPPPPPPLGAVLSPYRSLCYKRWSTSYGRYWFGGLAGESVGQPASFTSFSVPVCPRFASASPSVAFACSFAVCRLSRRLLWCGSGFCSRSRRARSAARCARALRAVVVPARARARRPVAAPLASARLCSLVPPVLSVVFVSSCPARPPAARRVSRRRSLVVPPRRACPTLQVRKLIPSYALRNVLPYAQRRDALNKTDIVRPKAIQRRIVSLTDSSQSVRKHTDDAQ